LLAVPSKRSFPGLGVIPIGHGPHAIDFDPHGRFGNILDRQPIVDPPAQRLLFLFVVVVIGKEFEGLAAGNPIPRHVIGLRGVRQINLARVLLDDVFDVGDPDKTFRDPGEACFVRFRKKLQVHAFAHRHKSLLGIDDPLRFAHRRTLHQK
jgi:hypothetical protein